MKLFLWGFDLKSGFQVHVLEANKRPTRVCVGRLTQGLCFAGGTSVAKVKRQDCSLLPEGRALKKNVLQINSLAGFVVLLTPNTM